MAGEGKRRSAVRLLPRLSLDRYRDSQTDRQRLRDRQTDTETQTGGERMGRAVLYKARLIKQLNGMKTAGRKQGRLLNARGLTERRNGMKTAGRKQGRRFKRQRG